MSAIITSARYSRINSAARLLTEMVELRLRNNYTVCANGSRGLAESNTFVARLSESAPGNVVALIRSRSLRYPSLMTLSLDPCRLQLVRRTQTTRAGEAGDTGACRAVLFGTRDEQPCKLDAKAWRTIVLRCGHCRADLPRPRVVGGSSSELDLYLIRRGCGGFRGWSCRTDLVARPRSRTRTLYRWMRPESARSLSGAHGRRGDIWPTTLVWRLANLAHRNAPRGVIRHRSLFG